MNIEKTAKLIIDHMNNQPTKSRISLGNLYTQHNISNNEALLALKLLNQNKKITFSVKSVQIGSITHIYTDPDEMININYANLL